MAFSCVGDARVHPLAARVLHPGAGDAERLVEDRVELVGVDVGGEPSVLAGAVAVEIAIADAREQGYVFLDRRRRGQASFSSQSVRITGCGARGG